MHVSSQCTRACVVTSDSREVVIPVLLQCRNDALGPSRHLLRRKRMSANGGIVNVAGTGSNLRT
jgi:hypothetical protein